MYIMVFSYNEEGKSNKLGGWLMRKSDIKGLTPKQIMFENNVDTVISFSNYCIVLLMNEDIPDNNVEAIDYNGNKVWNISQIVNLAYPEAYISIKKESEKSFSVVSYNGVEFVIDITTQQVIKKNITK